MLPLSLMTCVGNTLLIVRATARVSFCTLPLCYRGMNHHRTLLLLLSVFIFYSRQLIPADVAVYEHSTKYITLYSIHMTCITIYSFKNHNQRLNDYILHKLFHIFFNTSQAGGLWNSSVGVTTCCNRNKHIWPRSFVSVRFVRSPASNLGCEVINTYDQRRYKIWKIYSKNKIEDVCIAI
jgi:c-di-AMP phosphodiesterase-like protein